jgi:LmbE family N-acetylglucosaminyl deacetylase
MWQRVLRKLRQSVGRGDGSGARPPADATELGRLAALGTVVVFAPHPDDETLGCGGLIARLKDEGSRVYVVVMSDGSFSHPNSRRYPGPKMAALRATETRDAVALLGLDPTNELEFLGLPDGAVPGEAGTAAFAAAVDLVVGLLSRRGCDTVVAPLRGDAHDDHRAAFRIIDAALDRLGQRPRVLEYGIWGTPGRAGVAIDPNLTPFRHYFIDVSRVLRRKRAAIACHRSQTSNLIDDDPTGFRLSPRTIAHFSTRWESFHEACPTGVAADGTGG